MGKQRKQTIAATKTLEELARELADHLSCWDQEQEFLIAATLRQVRNDALKQVLAELPGGRFLDPEEISISEVTEIVQALKSKEPTDGWDTRGSGAGDIGETHRWRTMSLEDDICTALRQARNDALEEAARWADKHKGSAARRRSDRGNKLSNYDDFAAAEIQAEERGEDIAAEIIAACIRALKDKPND